MALGHPSTTRSACFDGELGQRMKWVRSIRAMPDARTVPNNERSLEEKHGRGPRKRSVGDDRASRSFRRSTLVCGRTWRMSLLTNSRPGGGRPPRDKCPKENLASRRRVARLRGSLGQHWATPERSSKLPSFCRQALPAWGSAFLPAGTAAFRVPHASMGVVDVPRMGAPPRRKLGGSHRRVARARERSGWVLLR